MRYDLDVEEFLKDFKYEVTLLREEVKRLREAFELATTNWNYGVYVKQKGDQC